MKIFQAIRNVIESKNLGMQFLVLFAFLTIVMIPVRWSGNVENYYQLAFKRVSPESFHQQHAVFDNSDGRIASEYVVGNVISVLGYEGALWGLTFLAIFGYAVALALLFRRLKFTLIDSLAVMGLFILMKQSLFAKAWLFGIAETKVFAYIFVVFAINKILDKRYYAALFCLVAASYCHFLVGLFWTVLLFTSVLILQKNIWKMLQYAGVFSLCMSPIVYILATQIFSPLTETSGLSADYIYTRLRNPHHIDPFHSTAKFLSDWLPGLIIMVAYIPAALFMWIRQKDNQLALISLVAASYIALFFLVAFIDRNTLASGKFYLFRPNSLMLLLAMSSVVFFFKNRSKMLSHWSYQGLVVLMACIALFPHARANARDLLRPKPSLATPELISVIQNRTTKDDIILIDPNEDWDERVIQLVRFLPRPTFVEWKFVPTEKNDIIRWYKRVELKKNVFEAGCTNTHSDFVYLLVFSDESFSPFSSCSDILYQDEELRLLAIRK